MRQIKIDPDNPAGVMMDTACDDGRTYASLRDASEPYPSLIVCPRALKHGSFDGPVWPGVADVNCDSIGPPRVVENDDAGPYFRAPVYFLQSYGGRGFEGFGRYDFRLG
jgi:hypothetical protein